MNNYYYNLFINCCAIHALGVGNIMYNCLPLYLLFPLINNQINHPPNRIYVKPMKPNGIL